MVTGRFGSDLDTARRLLYLYTALVAFSVLGSIASARFAIDPGFVGPVAGALLILSGAGCVAIALRSRRAVLSVLFLGAAVEVVGLYTGFPFGRYTYTDRWWPTVPLPEGHRFPLLLPFAWLLIVGGSFGAVRRRLRSAWAVPATALLATLIDWPMEQAMTGTLGYWTWAEPAAPFTAPVSNALGWFVTASLGSWAMYVDAERSDSRRTAIVPALFCLFVAAIGSLEGFHRAWVLLAAIGTVLLVVEWTAVRGIGATPRST
ncbi:MAG: carotenoid biosynthesis protein [Fimbriimonadaceae bacterium]|nr:carotenoid biosynthesis protein [Fimbriimonadaceae bacterium]